MNMERDGRGHDDYLLSLFIVLVALVDFSHFLAMLLQGGVIGLALHVHDLGRGDDFVFSFVHFPSAAYFIVIDNFHNLW